MAAQRTVSAYPVGYVRPGYSDLVGVAEIANILEVDRAVVGNWAIRWADWPEPLRVFSCGSIYSLLDVRRCLDRHGKTIDPNRI